MSLAGTGPNDHPVVRPMLLGSDERGARVSLVPEGALLLAGDAVQVRVVVGPGAHLELIEPGGTVAYAMDGGRATWDVEVEVGAAASLVWAGEPFIVAEGAHVRRETRLRLAWDSHVALREVMVLGRHDELPGRLHQSTSAVGPNDVPVLVESLTVGPDTEPLLLRGGRVIGTVTLLGDRLPDDLPVGAGTRLDLEAEGTVVRAVASQAHLAVAAEVWRTAATRRPTPPLALAE